LTAEPIDVSVVIPSLNEAETIGICIEKIKAVFLRYGIKGEVIVADNSDDDTPKIARSLGAKVVTPDKMGYGYAYLYGLRHANGKYIVLGDADDTYDFTEMPKLLKPLVNNEADIVIGSRFKGEIKKGAMPWLHRYIGNPLLTFLVNLFFNAKVSDAHSGFRAFKRDVLEKITLNSAGMEFASEMILKAVKAGLRISEVPITYYPRRGRSKLNSFKDGWRHLRFMLLFTPKYLFFVPSALSAAFGLFMLLIALLNIRLGYSPGIHSSILGSMLTVLGYNVFILGIFSDVYLSKSIGVKISKVTSTVLKKFTLEKSILLGLLLFVIGAAYVLYLFLAWIDSGFKVLPIRGENVLAFTLVVIGLQTVFYSFMLTALTEGI
jgi:glycosyltransferase involved in cell wall biosynthesis